MTKGFAVEDGEGRAVGWLNLRQIIRFLSAMRLGEQVKVTRRR